MPDDELPSRWLGTFDPRFAGLRDIARFIESAFQTQVTVEDVVDSGFQVGTYLFPPPLELASLMEESARRIRDLTSDQA